MADTSVADRAINDAIVKLTDKLGSLFSNDNETIEQIAKLRASMSPQIVQKKK